MQILQMGVSRAGGVEACFGLRIELVQSALEGAEAFDVGVQMGCCCLWIGAGRGCGELEQRSVGEIELALEETLLGPEEGGELIVREMGEGLFEQEDGIECWRCHCCE